MDTSLIPDRFSFPTHQTLSEPLCPSSPTRKHWPRRTSYGWEGLKRINQTRQKTEPNLYDSLVSQSPSDTVFFHCDSARAQLGHPTHFYTASHFLLSIKLRPSREPSNAQRYTGLNFLPVAPSSINNDFDRPSEHA